MWALWIRPIDFKLLSEGKVIEKLFDNGLLSIRAVAVDPAEGGPLWKITLFTEEEAGARLTHRGGARGV